MSIYENCLLISLSISMPPKTRKARGASTGIEQKYRTVKGKAKVVKNLFSKQDLQPLVRARDAADKFLKENTLPFGNHHRIIPADQFFKFAEDIGKYRAEFEHQKQRFLNYYYLSLSRAEFELGDLFDETNYPTEAYLSNYIQMVIETSVVAPTNAFDRIAGFSEEEAAKLTAEAFEQQQGKLKDAMKSLVKRLLKTLQYAVSRLSKEDSVFRNTLLSNIHESVEAIRSLNITGDEELIRLADKVEDIIQGLSANDLRRDKELRKETVEEAKGVIDQLAEFF